jgi:release factor glutamine methyltransferase
VSPTAPPRPLELTRLAAEHLAARGVDDARLEAELLLAHVLGVRRLDLYLQFERPLEPPEVEAFREALRRRSRREPLQHITGEASFRELTLAVDARVLVPRPETEVLVGEVLDHVADHGPAGVALDIGTGSGAIALSLLHEGGAQRVVATDVEPGALEVAASNAARLGLSDRIELRRGSVWDPIGEGERYTVIVANPPYIADGERASLMPEVRDWEPAAALFAGRDGLAVIREIVAGAGAHLDGGGLLALEVAPGQTEEVVALMESAGLSGPRVTKDLAGRERVVLATANESSNEVGAP